MKRFVVVATAVALLVGGSSIAQAQVRPSRTPGPAFESAKQACEKAIDNRMERLQTLRTLVSGSQHVTADHRTTLDTQMANAEQGLAALKSKIDGDTDPATLRTDCRSIVDDYRIYVLVSPKVREILVADWESDIATRLDGIATRIQAAIDKAKAKGKDETTAQTDLDQMKSKIADARAAIGGVASSVVNLQPSDWPGAHDTLATGRTSLRSGRDDLRGARDAGWAAAQALRQS